MRNLFLWAKANPISLVAIVLAIAALVILGMVQWQSGAFVEQLQKRQTLISQIDALSRHSVRIPPEKPDDPPVQVSNITINQAAIGSLKHVYDRMSQEYTSIYLLAVKINQDRHVPMLDGLFPEVVDASRPYEARDQYKRSFLEMLGRPVEGSPLPHLNAGGPPPAEEIDAELRRVEEDYRANVFFGSREARDLSAEQAQKLRDLKSRRLLEVLQRRAASIHLYAATQFGPDFPFHVGAWANESRLPDITQMWEGQVGLWVQQDIVEAIARTNRVSEAEANVANAPVKRLLQIRLIAPYVGILPGTGMGGTYSAAADGYLASAGQVSNPDAMMMGGAPGAPVLPPIATASVDQRLADNFALAPTGRQSNPIYDVHHAFVSMIVDSQRLPEFFDNLAKVNFMSVLRMDMSGVDEYEALRQGYFYGIGDVVKVDMVIETVWLRRWTAGHRDEQEAKQFKQSFDRGLMPDVVRQRLGLEPRRTRG